MKKLADVRPLENIIKAKSHTFIVVSINIYETRLISQIGKVALVHIQIKDESILPSYFCYTLIRNVNL